MRVRLVGVFLAGFMHAAGAGELDQAYMRGSQVYEIAPPRPVVQAASYPASSVAPYAVAPPNTTNPNPFAAAFAEVRSSSLELGTRYWFATGNLAKNLYDDPRASTNLNSRLTYDGLTAGSYEAFGRWDNSSVLIKGTVGLGNLSKGKLNDEDFPPAIDPYSSTLSQQQGGRINYATADIGATVASNAQSRFAVFAGFGYLSEKANAFGCTQVATNPFVCAPAIATDVLGITESTRWQFLRIGATGDYNITDRLKFTAEFAWLPYARMAGTDTHWLRLGTTPFSFSGPIPEGGTGSGIQIEALLSYQIWNCFSVGVGGRFWNLQTSGVADLERMIVGLPFAPAAQPLDFKTTRYGAFVQGSYKFGMP
jgi:hypothetical protein